MKTSELLYIKDRKYLQVSTGYESEVKLQSFIEDQGLSLITIDRNVFEIKEISEESYAAVKRFVELLDESAISDFLEITSLDKLSEELAVGIDCLESLSVDNVDADDEDSLLLTIDDISSTEERLGIIKKKILDNIGMNPMLDKRPLMDLSGMLDELALTEFSNTAKLEELGKIEIRNDFSLATASDNEKKSIQAIALIDFLIKNSSNYISSYMTLLEKVNSILN